MPCCRRVLERLGCPAVAATTLRCPAISRLQKVHNVEVGFGLLSKAGVELTANSRSGAIQKLDSRDIVDGHREKTLGLLWKLIYHFQVSLLSFRLLFVEIIN